MHYLRDLGRRKVRTSLTILGITIGIWALVVFGSMANKISAMVSGGSTYYADKITLSDATAGGSLGGFSSTPMSLQTADQVLQVPGVDFVEPEVMMLMGGPSTVNMGVPPIIGASAPGGSQGRDTLVLHAATGRLLTAADEGQNVTVLGSDIARTLSGSVGQTVKLKGLDFQVVGILEPTLTAPDQEAIIPFDVAQVMFIKSLPPMFQSNISAANLATSMVVYLKAGEDPAAVASRIKAMIPMVATMTGADFDQQVGSATSILNAILVGIALISLIVGGLSVINTMAMSIAERTREIGIKRAIGGSRSRIVRELVTESALMGLIGGLLGLGFGAVVCVYGNEVGRTSGTILFELTPGTAISAVAFATILGAIAGFVPALHAARLDPVTALRYE
jgi:putative ABC transport system permease protein